MVNLNILSIIAALQTKETKLPKEFAILNDDRGDMYLNSIINLIKSYTKINKQTIRNTEYRDLIVFTENDVYLENNHYDVTKLRIPILSLIKEYTKVENYIRNYFKNVYSNNDTLCKGCPYSNLCLQLNKESHDTNEIIYDGDIINAFEKVSVKYNFVKVGYDQYDIINTGLIDLVNIEGDIFEINNDRRGRKYLKLIS